MRVCEGRSEMKGRRGWCYAGYWLRFAMVDADVGIEGE
jgi:hypothetical protein